VQRDNQLEQTRIVELARVITGRFIEPVEPIVERVPMHEERFGGMGDVQRMGEQRLEQLPCRRIEGLMRCLG